MLKQFLAQLGKPQEIADALKAMTGQNVSVGSVYQWPYENSIPHRWRFHVAKLAKKKKIKEVPPEIRSFMQ